MSIKSIVIASSGKAVTLDGNRQGPLKLD